MIESLRSSDRGSLVGVGRYGEGDRFSIGMLLLPYHHSGYRADLAMAHEGPGNRSTLLSILASSFVYFFICQISATTCLR
jgi:hypothetical protein